MARRNTATSYVATDTFVCEIDGVQEWVRAGKTRVAAGHVLLERYAGAFEPADDHALPEVEQATAAPGERRGAPSA